MAKYLVTYSDTLDEIEINGFTIMTEKEMESYEELASSITWSFSYPMGEEQIRFSSGEDLLNKIDFREITNDEFKIIKKVFNSDFGVFIDEDFLTGIAGDEDENDSEFDDEDDIYPNYRDDEDDDY